VKIEKRKIAIGETNRARSPANVAPRQVAWPPHEQRQRLPQFAFEMRDAVEDLMPDRPERAVDMARLAACVAMRADQCAVPQLRQMPPWPWPSP
jgi:UDP:flavonoid glycosyltransferase YjiC (YdhE family)